MRKFFAGAVCAAAVIVLAACGGNSESADEYRAKAAAACVQPVEDLTKDAPTLEDSPAEAEKLAKNQRTAARTLRNLDGPDADEKQVRELARQMDEMAAHFEKIAAAIRAGDQAALNRATEDGSSARQNIMTRCSTIEEVR